jgi:outer membrane protein OmpA-like peptidoglycan-associated protein
MSVLRSLCLIVLGLMLIGVAPAKAADPSSSAVDFASAPISFSASKIDLPSSEISFYSALMQTETAQTIEVTLPADILFDFDKADIRPTAERALKEVADLIRSKARGPVAIQGYTDALGADLYNQKLSERRAASVKTWLSTKEALPSAGFKVAGYGPRNPVAPNKKSDGSDDPEGRQLNRRVTLIIHK